MQEAASPPAGTVTFLYTDIEGTTDLLRRLGQPCYTAALEEHHRLLRGVVRQAGGYEISTGGDSFFVSFPRAIQALAAAVAAQRALAAHRWPEGASVRVRMGLHTGEAAPADGVHVRRTYIHGEVNRAARVSAAAHGGQIVISQTTGELVRDHLPAGLSLRDLGCYHLRGMLHPERLFQAVLPDLRQEFPALNAEPLPSPPTREGVAAAPTAEPGALAAAMAAIRVALLYKRGVHPDEQLLKRLETELTASGCRVFIDRHMTIGVEWAKEIERQVRAADAVIPLLSAASVQSEMLQYELQIANEAAQQHGKPRLLPVRVNYAGPLPDPLAAILRPIHYTLWDSAADDERLVAELIHALKYPSSPGPPVPPAALEPVGGAVPLDSRFYVVRPTDEQFRTAIARRDSIVLVKGARQMGKTSLLARGLQQARDAGARVVLTDLQLLNPDQLRSTEALYLALAEWLAEQLDLAPPDAVAWEPGRSPNLQFQRYLRREVLGRLDAGEPRFDAERQRRGPVPGLVWGMDEVDRLFSCPFATEVFGMFRSWHNARSLDPAGPWSQLTLAIAYAHEAHLFITDMNQSPFNVGTRLTLEDFTAEQVQDLNQRYGSPLRDAEALSRFAGLLGGHPYLLRRGLHELVTGGMDLATFEATADRDEGIYGDHLRRILVLLARDVALQGAVRAVLNRQPCPSPEVYYRLRSAGVLAGESATAARVRCRLYASYLERHLR